MKENMKRAGKRAAKIAVYNAISVVIVGIAVRAAQARLTAEEMATIIVLIPALIGAAHKYFQKPTETVKKDAEKEEKKLDDLTIKVEAEKDDKDKDAE